MLEFRRVLLDRKSTRLNSSHTIISYAVFCLKKLLRTKTPGLTRAHVRRARAAPGSRGRVRQGGGALGVAGEGCEERQCRSGCFFFLKAGAPRNFPPPPHPPPPVV